MMPAHAANEYLMGVEEAAMAQQQQQHYSHSAPQVGGAYPAASVYPAMAQQPSQQQLQQVQASQSNYGQHADGQYNRGRIPDGIRNAYQTTSMAMNSMISAGFGDYNQRGPYQQHQNQRTYEQKIQPALSHPTAQYSNGSYSSNQYAKEFNPTSVTAATQTTSTFNPIPSHIPVHQSPYPVRYGSPPILPSSSVFIPSSPTSPVYNTNSVPAQNNQYRQRGGVVNAVPTDYPDMNIPQSYQPSRDWYPNQAPYAKDPTPYPQYDRYQQPSQYHPPGQLPHPYPSVSQPQPHSNYVHFSDDIGNRVHLSKDNFYPAPRAYQSQPDPASTHSNPIYHASRFPDNNADSRAVRQQHKTDPAAIPVPAGLPSNKFIHPEAIPHTRQVPTYQEYITRPERVHRKGALGKDREIRELYLTAEAEQERAQLAYRQQLKARQQQLEDERRQLETMNRDGYFEDRGYRRMRSQYESSDPILQDSMNYKYKMRTGKFGGVYRPVDHLGTLLDDAHFESNPVVASNHIHNSTIAQNPYPTVPNASILQSQFNTENVPSTTQLSHSMASNQPLSVGFVPVSTQTENKAVELSAATEDSFYDPQPNSSLDQLHEKLSTKKMVYPPVEKIPASINPNRQFETREMRLSRENLEDEVSRVQMQARERLENDQNVRDHLKYEEDLRRWTVEQTLQNSKLRMQARERNRGTIKLW